LRGVSLIVSATVVTEIGDVNRFPNPQQLMAYQGLIPSEHSSGKKVSRARLPKRATTMCDGFWSRRLGHIKCLQTVDASMAWRLMFCFSISFPIPG
jgi:transposase